jgi:predicted N-acetyltransferase YhbS
MIRYRWARREDLEELLDLIGAGFAIRPDGKVDEVRGREHRILFSYLYSRPTWRPDWVTVAEINRRLVAAVGFFPQKLNLGRVSLPVWAVSPVVVHPEKQGQGYGGNCLIQALTMVEAWGVPAVFLWGIPPFYPKYGFIPLLPRYQTKLTQNRFRKISALPGGKLRPLQDEADLRAIAALYDSRAAELWLQPQRTWQWWMERLTEIDCEQAELHEVPFPKKGNFLVWENFEREIVGYLYTQPEISKKKLVITEAAASDCANAQAMVESLINQYLTEGETLIIRGTPDHYLNIAAYRLGGTHVNPAPLAGMIKVLDWDGCFSYIASEIGHRRERLSTGRLTLAFQTNQGARELKLTAAGLELTRASTTDLMLDETQLTCLLFGLADITDWRALSVSQAQELRRIFPSRYPFIWDANYLY